MKKESHVKIKHHLFSLLVITFLCSIIYSNVLHGPFVFDDYQDIVSNHFIRLDNFGLQGLYDAAFNSPSTVRPVANISFALNYYMGGYEVVGFHLTNIAIHLVCGILVYFITLLTLRQVAIIQNQTNQRFSDYSMTLMAVSTALIFIAHPIQTQSVTYIVQRMSSLAALFYFLSLLLYILGRRSELNKTRWLLWFGCLASWILALGSKQTAVTLPIIIVLYEWYFFQDLNKAWIKQNVIYFSGLILILILIGLIYLGGNPIDRILGAYDYREFSIGERLLTQFRVVVYYISLLLYPHPSRLNLLHEFPLSYSLFQPATTLFSLLFLSGLLGLAILFAQRQRLISFCILWFFINLLVTSSVIALEIIFEHRLYLPMFGFAIIISYLFFKVFAEKRRYIVAIVAIVIALGVGTYSRNKVWTDRIDLWSDVISKNPQSHRGYYNLGQIFAAQEDLDEAIIYFQHALQLKPHIIWIQYSLAETHYNLGNNMQRQGNYEQAINHYNEATRLKPIDVKSYNNLGGLYISQGKIDDALIQLTEAVRIDPHNETIHYNLGYAQAQIGNTKTACTHYLQAMRLKPDFPAAQRNYSELCDLGKDYKR
jgi:tetratricopeptide (TPR) repeat protein